jgi:capsular exopolysaccharide synthesis family protein
MSRLHGALQRASEGKAPILPPEAGTGSDEGIQASQPAFSVPWTLDSAAAAEAPPRSFEGASAADSDHQPAFASLPLTRMQEGATDTDEKLVGSTAPDTDASLAQAVEQYRKLAATLHHAQADRGLKLIMVTSANPSEGKSLTASNLALTLSESYQRRVLLIDGDLRRPSLHEIFGVPNRSGLSDGLARNSIDGLPVAEVSPRLSVLPSGHPLEDPTGVLTSGQMRAVLEEARAAYDWTIVDTPPIGLLTDARLLAEMVDGVVLVIEAGKSPYADILRAVETIGRGRLLGAVLNRLNQGSGRARYYKSYYGRPSTPRG